MAKMLVNILLLHEVTFEQSAVSEICPRKHTLKPQHTHQQVSSGSAPSLRPLPFRVSSEEPVGAV